MIITFLAMILLFFSVLGPEFLTTGKISANSTNLTALVVPFIIFSIILMISSLIISSYVSAATVGMSKSIVFGENLIWAWDLEMVINIFENHRCFDNKVNFVNGFCYPLIMGFADYAYGIAPALTLIGVLVSLVLWVVTMILLIFTSQSIVVCGESVIGSIKDSIRVLRENISDVIIVIVINIIIAFCIFFVVGIIKMLLSLIPIVDLF